MSKIKMDDLIVLTGVYIFEDYHSHVTKIFIRVVSTYVRI